MVRRGLLLVLALLLLPLGGAYAEEATEATWTQVEAVPPWVLDPPAQEGVIRLADVGMSNLLRLLFPAHAYARQGRAALANRLRPVLAEASDDLAAALPASPPTRKAYYHQQAAAGRRATIGGSYYVAFVLWEFPRDAVLAAVPEAKREAVALLLDAPLGAPGVAWQDVSNVPAWAEEVEIDDAAYRVATQERARRRDIGEALSVLRANVRWPIQARLKPVLGNDLAFAVAVNAASQRKLLERAIHTATQKRLLRAETHEYTLFQRWEVPLDAILSRVPEAWRDAARTALGGPVPPRATTWVAVSATPAWAQSVRAWPGHVPVVQIRRSNLVELAKQRAAKLSEADVARTLEAKLAPLVPPAAARTASVAGARSRTLARHAIREGPPPPSGQEAVPGGQVVTAWSLWQVPLDAVLDAIPADRHAAVRAALLPDR